MTIDEIKSLVNPNVLPLIEHSINDKHIPGYLHKTRDNGFYGSYYIRTCAIISLTNQTKLPRNWHPKHIGGAYIIYPWIVNSEESYMNGLETHIVVGLALE